MLNLEKLGVPGVPLVGYTRSVRYGWTVDEHAHAGCLEIGLCLRGSLVLESGADRHTIMPGDLFVNHPDQVHRLQALPKGGVHYWIHLRLSDAPPGFLGLPAPEIHALRRRLNRLPCRVTADTARIASAFRRLLKCHSSLSENYRMFALRSACMSLVFEIAELTGKQQPLAGMDKLSAIIERIRAHPEQKINLDALAKEAALSSTRFINVFKQVTGFPPLHYQLVCRLNEAKRRLKESDESITDIAAALGFSSSQHFSTHFKKMFGCTPTSCRRSVRA
jgi:AraC-like DNA-binding protein